MSARQPPGAGCSPASLSSVLYAVTPQPFIPSARQQAARCEGKPSPMHANRTAEPTRSYYTVLMADWSALRCPPRQPQGRVVTHSCLCMRLLPLPSGMRKPLVWRPNSRRRCGDVAMLGTATMTCGEICSSDVQMLANGPMPKRCAVASQMW